MTIADFIKHDPKGWRTFHGGKTPFGFERERGQLREVASELAIVRRIRTLGKMKGPQEIAEALNQDHIGTPSGHGRWSRGQVWYVLRNPIYGPPVKRDARD